MRVGETDGTSLIEGLVVVVGTDDGTALEDGTSLIEGLIVVDGTDDGTALTEGMIVGTEDGTAKLRLPFLPLVTA